MSSPHRESRALNNLGPAEYKHGASVRTGSRDAPQVTPSDHEIQVGTAWAPLLAEASDTRMRPEASSAAKAYAAGDRLFTLEDLFSARECELLIDAAEGIGFGRTSYPKQYRGNLRLMTVDPSLTEAVWRRMRHLVPGSVQLDGQTWTACGLNECWRLAKYVPGDRFGAHCDACFERDERECSMFTVNIYMNDVPEEHGGSTRFYADPRRLRERDDHREPVLSVRPAAGLGVVFRQPPGEELLHDGEELSGGVKYLFRSDVMYRRD